MRYVYTLSVVLLCGWLVPAVAQTPDSVMEGRMTRRVLTCGDIILNTTYLLPQYHEAGNQDSIEAVLGFLRSRCGTYDNLIDHYRTLYAIDTSGRLDTSGREGLHFWQLAVYRRAFYPDEEDDKSEYSYWSRSYYNTEAYTAPGYYPFLKSYGATLAARTDLSPDAAWMARYYASGGDSSLFHQLDSPIYRGTRLQREYRQYKRFQRAQRTVYVMSAQGGLWSPQSNLSLLGTKGMAGLELGGWGPRLGVSGYLYGVFGRSRMYYNTLYRDSLISTDHFFVGGVGLRADYAVWKEGAVEATVGLSVGYESLSLVKDATPDDDVNDGKHLPTFNLAPGVSVNYYVSPSVFVNFFGRYHIVNYQNDAVGTSFAGNAFVVGVGIGGGSELRKRRVGK